MKCIEADCNNERMKGKTYCKDCEELYKPSGKFQKYCEKCKNKRRRESLEEMKRIKQFVAVKND